MLIYNLCPAPAAPGKQVITWADGRSPFSRQTWEAAGFRVVAFDNDDSAAARRMAYLLRWDSGPEAMDIEKDLFALYTLVEKPLRLSRPGRRQSWPNAAPSLRGSDAAVRCPERGSTITTTRVKPWASSSSINW